MKFKLKVHKDGNLYIPIWKPLSNFEWINKVNNWLENIGAYSDFRYSYPNVYKDFRHLVIPDNKAPSNNHKVGYYQVVFNSENEAIEFLNNLTVDPITFNQIELNKYNERLPKQSKFVKVVEFN